MITSTVRLSKGFGNLGPVIRGTTKYHLSPFEQKAFKGALIKGLPNSLWRVRTNILYWGPSKSFWIKFANGLVKPNNLTIMRTMPLLPKLLFCEFCSWSHFQCKEKDFWFSRLPILLARYLKFYVLQGCFS